MRLSTRVVLISLLIAAIAIAAYAANRPSSRLSAGKATSILVPRAVPVKPAVTVISPEAKIDRVVVKLVEGTRARLSGSQIVSLAGKDLGTVNASFGKSANTGIQRLAIKSPEAVEAEKALLEAKCGRQLADMNNYFKIPVSSPAQAEALVNQLNRLPEVELAYAAPRPEPAVDIPPTTPDYSGNQTYLTAAPSGVDAVYAQTLPGGDGSGVQVADVEGDWKYNHEDLEISSSKIVGGIPSADIDWRNHGTAVLGEMVGENNGYGITGIAPGATVAYLLSIFNMDESQGMLMAGDSLQPGDAMLIELHAPGPRYNFQSRTDQLGYVCMEYWQADFDALQLAWAKGIIVCEAAGNGAENLDDVIYASKFDTTYRNSHAIICGAGAPPSGNYGADRSRLSFSNYGARVNLQGYGREVTTCGYGDLFNGNSDEQQYYTSTFSGTSSASPIVTGSVLALQGIYKAQYGNAVMNSDRIRDVLIATGSPQQSNTTQHIGPRPNLRAASAALTAPPDLTLDPIYIDTTIAVNTQIAVYIDLYNSSSSTTLEYSAATQDSIMLQTSIADWLIVPTPTGAIAPLSHQSLEVDINAGAVPSHLDTYKGLVNINFGSQGGPLSDLITLPVFMTIPCNDTTYTPTASFQSGGPTYNWVDITGSGTMIQSFYWYNPSVTSGSKIDDGTAGPYSIGFAFPYYDTTYSRVFIGANGGISFTDSNVNVNGYYGQFSIPGPPFATFVAPFWNDLNFDHSTSGAGNVFYYRAPTKDSFIVEYYHAGNFNSTADSLTTFEVILTKNGAIKFQYQSIGTTGLQNTAIIGVAALDCKGKAWCLVGVPSANVVGNSTAVQFHYNYIITEPSGDANNDGTINVGDVVFLINYIFKGGPAPVHFAKADVNCDAHINVADAVYLINYIFKSGLTPCRYPI